MPSLFKGKRSGLCALAAVLLLAVAIAASSFLASYAPGKDSFSTAESVGTGSSPDQSPGRFAPIKLAADEKAVLDAQTGRIIFTIEEVHRFLRDSGYAYDENTFQSTAAKYDGDCLSEAVLSHDQKSIAFATSCLPGDLPQLWLGVYRRDGFRLIYGGGGDSLAWTEDDKSVNFRAYLGLTGSTFAKAVDMESGAIRSREDCAIYAERQAFSRDMCYREAAETERDEAYCAKITMPELRADCYVALAFLLDDYRICQGNGLTAALSSDCAEHFGIIKK